jgi:hypothetical protein
MTLPTYVRALLGADPGLNDESVDITKIFLSHDLDTPKVRPMIVLNWGRTNPGMGAINRRLLQVWIHDNPGDYERIDRCLQHVRAAFDDIAGINTGTAGQWLSQIDWEGDSDNLVDDVVGTFARYGEYTFTGSAA